MQAGAGFWGVHLLFCTVQNTKVSMLIGHVQCQGLAAILLNQMQFK